MRKIAFAVFFAIGLAGIANIAKADYYLWGYSFTVQRLSFVIRTTGGGATLPAVVSGQWLDQDGVSIGDSLDLGTHTLPAGSDRMSVERRDEFLWDEDSIPSGARRLRLNVKPAGTSVPGHNVELSRPLPDLTIDSIALDPTYGYPIVTIKNVGTYKVTSSISVFYSWSAANQYGYSQIYSHSYTVNLNNLYPGSAHIAKPSNSSMDLAIDPRADSLSVTIGRTFSHASGGNPSGGAYQVVESDYTNNDKNVNVDISFPDLAIDSVTFDSTWGYPAVAIKNIGAGKAKYPALRVYYGWSSGRYSRSYEVNLDLNPGQTFITKPANPSFDLAPDPAAGSISMNIGLDTNNRGQIIETDYDNNYYGRPVDVSFPDLAIDSVAFDSTLGYPIVTIKNIGTNVAKRAGFTVGYEYSVSGQTFNRSYNVDLDLAPGQTYIAKPNNPSAFGPGIKSMVLTIGRDGYSGNYQIFESDYGNNRKTVDTTFPDLAIQSVNFDSTYSYPIVTIKNIGVSKARHPAFTVSYKVNSVLRSYEVNLDLDARETLVARPANPSSGISFLEGPATDLKIGQDAQGNYQLAEFDYKNNKAAFPDFAIDSVTFDTNTKALNVTISNVGSVTARFTAEEWDGGPAVELTCHKVGESSAEGYNCQQGKYLTTSAQDSLDPGAKITINFPALEADVKYIDVSVNIPVKLSELNLSNNAKKEVTVPVPKPLPDLIIESVTFGTSREPIITVKNQGTAAARGPNTQIKYVWLDAKGQEGGGYGGPLGNTYFRAGQTFQLDLFGPNPSFGADDIGKKLPGSDAVKILVTVDGTDRVAESSEDNNTKEAVVPAVKTSTPTPDKENMKYPIAELGNCASVADCKAYCNEPKNAEACANFGTKTGLLTKEEAKAAKEINKVAADLGCKTKEECKDFCNKRENITTCLDKAKNWMSSADLAKAKKVADILLAEGPKKIETPGGCDTPEKCKDYCSDNKNAVECVKFGKASRVLTDEEAAEAEKVAPLMQSGQMPGGETTRAGLEKYCETHRDKCDEFFGKAGVKKGKGPEGGKPGERPGEEPPPGTPKDETKATPIFKGGVGPGGCRNKKECDEYCDAHPGECDKQVEEAGGEVKKPTVICSTRKECKALCDNPKPENKEACRNVVIKKEPPESKGPTVGGESEEQIKANLRRVWENLKQMPEQSGKCIEEKWGRDNFAKLKQLGENPDAPFEPPTTPLGPEIMQPCFAQGVQMRDEEAARKPEGQEERDAEYERMRMMNTPPPGGNVLQILQGAERTLISLFDFIFLEWLR